MIFRPTKAKLSPVITLLSPSPGASRRAQEILKDVFGLQPKENDLVDKEVSSSSSGIDPLDQKFQSSLVSLSWDSVVSECPQSGTVLHWLSIKDTTNNNTTKNISDQPFSLLGITHEKTLPETRKTLADQFPDSTFLLRLRQFLKRPITSDMLLSRHQGLPILELPTTSENEHNGKDENATTSDTSNNNNNKPTKTTTGRLKEIAFTTYDEAHYETGETVLSRLSSSSGLSRPVTGLYESLTSGLYVRPLPVAQQDIQGTRSSVVLTFYSDNVQAQLEQQQQLQDSSDINTDYLYRFGKIGYTGIMGRGQVRVEVYTNDAKDDTNNKNNCLPGLDVRWCESTTPTSMFNEAHESLLASSLEELQSTSVLGSKNAAVDEKIGSSDCWVEVRTMVKNPKRFWQRKGHRIATAPPSYPE